MTPSEAKDTTVVDPSGLAEALQGLGLKEFLSNDHLDLQRALWLQLPMIVGGPHKPQTYPDLVRWYASALLLHLHAQPEHLARVISRPRGRPAKSTGAAIDETVDILEWMRQHPEADIDALDQKQRQWEELDKKIFGVQRAQGRPHKALPQKRTHAAKLQEKIEQAARAHGATDSTKPAVRKRSRK